MNMAFFMTTIARCCVGCGVGAADGQSLHVLECDTETGAAKIVQSVTNVQGTTYFTFDRQCSSLYSYIGEMIDGKRKGSLVRFKIDGGMLGAMERLSALPCEAPCHISLSPDEGTIGFAAYTSATAGTMSLKDGKLRCVVHSNDGVGPNRERQKKAYAHCAFFTPDGRTMGVVDLGTDRINFYDPATMAQKKDMTIHADPGDGPRHVVWSKNGKHLFVVNELGNSVMSFAFDGKGFSRVGKWSTLPSDCAGVKTKAAAIKLTADGQLLMASNRGHDSIAFYSVDPERGVLSMRNIAKLRGSFPRDFELMPGERFMVVGHKMDNEIQVYAFDRAGCTLTPVGKPIGCWRPLCFKFMD